MIASNTISSQLQATPRHRMRDRRDRPLRLLINGVPLGAGGALTGLVGYVTALRECDPSLEITIIASRDETIRATRAMDTFVIPVVQSGGLARQYLWQKFRVAELAGRLKCDVLLTTNFAIPGSPIPQVVHHQNLFTMRTPGIASVTHLKGWKRWIQNVDTRHALRVADANVFVSDYLRRAAERICPTTRARNYVVYNGLSDLAINDAINGPPPWKRTARICAVQSPFKHKNTSTLLAVFAKLLRARPEVDWSLAIAGGGNWARYRREAQQLNVLSRIQWLGHLDEPKLIELFRGSLCLIFTSAFESFGNPPIEAMAQGCPPVVVDATALPEIVGNAAIRVPPGDVDAFVNATIRLWDSPETRADWARRARDRARHFSWRRSGEQLRDILESVTA